MDVKTASGKTTWPLASRDMAWDGGEAHNAIVAKATKEDGSIDEGLMKSVHFWYDESAPDKITSYKLLFCDVVSGDIKAIPRGIFACTGGHGLAVADIPDGDVAGIKSKIATYYTRMANEFDDSSIEVPWKDDGKSMDAPQQTKTFFDHYAEEMCENLLSNLCSVWFAAFCDMVTDAFKIGDQPDSDINDGLDAFHAQFMKDWVAPALACNMSAYLSTNDIDSPLNSYSGDYGYMSRDKKPSAKVGRTISSATQDKLQQHQEDMKALFDQHKSMVNESMKAMQQKVSDLTQIWQEEGLGEPYTNDDGKSNTARREPPQALTREAQPLMKSTVEMSIDELEAILAV